MFPVKNKLAYHFNFVFVSESFYFDWIWHVRGCMVEVALTRIEFSDAEGKKKIVFKHTIISTTGLF